MGTWKMLQTVSSLTKGKNLPSYLRMLHFIIFLATKEVFVVAVLKFMTAPPPPWMGMKTQGF